MKKGWSDLMDRRVKERLVGATILVVLIVLIVPELLSGPKPKPAAAPIPAHPEEPVGPPPVRNVTVDLLVGQTTGEAETAAPSAAAPPPPDTPSAPAASAEDAASAAAPRDQPAAPAGAMPRRDQAPPTITTLRAQQAAQPALENEGSPPRSAPAAAVPRRGWVVQLGSFASRVNAETLVHRLKAHDSSAYVSSGGKGPALRYRVRIGPLADRAAAERVRLKLVKEGYAASLVFP